MIISIILLIVIWVLLDIIYDKEIKQKGANTMENKNITKINQEENDRFKFRARVLVDYYESYEDWENDNKSTLSLIMDKVDVMDGGTQVGKSFKDIVCLINQEAEKQNLGKYAKDSLIQTIRENNLMFGVYCVFNADKIWQATGRKDKNGVLIYEGDIITTSDNDEGVVMFGSSCLKFFMDFGYELADLFEDYEVDELEVKGHEV